MNGDDADQRLGDLEEEAYAQTPEHLVEQPSIKTNFAAWHHPRKQYVRINQWCKAVKEIIPELGLSRGDPFRYLTLPGNELLDVRALHGVCSRLDVSLRYLGFNSVGRNTPAQAELALSQSEVRSLSHVDGFSRVIEDRLETVAVERSPAFVQTQRSGPFHAINLDLCDSIAFRNIGSGRGSPLEALAKLLELQLQSTKPWLLFITTKAEPDLVGELAKEGFSRAIFANAEASTEFREALARLIEADLDALAEAVETRWNGHDPRFLRLFCTGLGKWLLSLLSAAVPSRELRLLSSCFYQSGPHGPDMLSLAFRCTTSPQNLRDRYEILPEAEPISVGNEIEFALNLARDVGEMFNLDEMLSANQELQDRLIVQAARLLSTARYDGSAYEEWARDRLVQSTSAVEGS